MEVILYEPQIPQNTGNIIRTCSVTNTSLTLVKPLGFSLSEKNLRRAGLDYHHGVEIQTIDDLEVYLKNCDQNFYFLSSHAKKTYSDIEYTENDVLIFGSESFGLDPKFLRMYEDRFITIPMTQKSRCLNLSNCVSIVLYESLRQQNFMHLL
ncbi:tRNA (uridine(34)/cytosine(34)/5-carboxymethylaminomethyluridine(34)-2'-O)-methyltransferase TrmL [Candidatus Aerophobetes bacterium]|uniref:Putative tRNA (cytidine(34)-2'-O)-methyltransferase n=1 Tax=Aerophobetes bacterium TaxID=2030807 RepID=A0A2A4YLF5_UNCAE|nr:MAG: tRNA (uridine(34)/cytosine(34)/5-carboxymethylaminomethyluridine(34)-2'-O)-methyltransferase TrmL [Candidatus Aerophobetes bacterium]